MLLETVNSNAVCDDNSATNTVGGMRRRALSPEEKEASRRLKNIWEKKKKDLHLTQEEAAHRCGWNTQAAFYQYLNGIIPLNVEALVKISKVLQVDPSEIYPEHTQRIGIAGRHVLEAKEDNVVYLSEEAKQLARAWMDLPKESRKVVKKLIVALTAGSKG